MSAGTLLAALQKVRQTGHGRWIAACPAHEDKTASLSIRELDGEKTLIHCFAGCSVHEVVQAAGIELSDLFPPRQHHGKPERNPFPASDALRCLSFEGMVIAASGRQILTGIWSESEQSRLVDAVSRISAAMTACGVRP